MGVSDFSSTSVAGLRSLTFPALSDHPASDTDEISLLPCKRLPNMHRVSDRVGSVHDLRFSYGFRQGRGQHDALDALSEGISGRKVNWILDADIRSFFDEIDQIGRA